MAQVTLILGPMFSGKTTTLLQCIQWSQKLDKPVQVFKPKLDTRYLKHAITSHDGKSAEATPVVNAGDILLLVDENTRMVVIDESQFFGWEVSGVCLKLSVTEGIDVVCAGLERDFRGEDFGPIPLLKAIRNVNIQRLKATCSVCGRKNKATETQRLIGGQPAHYDEPTIQVGGSESYEARCKRCHEIPGKPTR